MSKAGNSFEKAVMTQMPKNLDPVKIREKKFQEMLSTFKMEKLRQIPYTEKGIGSQAKAALVTFYAKLFTFTSQEEFDAWLCLFPPDSQWILSDLALHKCRPIEYFETQRDGLNLMAQHSHSFWLPALDVGFNLGFIDIIRVADHFALAMPSGFCAMLRPWFVYSNEYFSFDACALDHVDADKVYNQAKEVSASLPLLCESLVGGGFDVEEIMHATGPMTKRKLAVLYAQSGFRPFPYTADDAPDALDLTARFLLAMLGQRLVRPDNGQDYLKALIKIFFSENFREIKNTAPIYRGELFEYYVLLTHFKRRAFSWWNHADMLPKSRKLFFELLLRIAKDGRWFSSSSLARYQYLCNDDWYSSLHCLDYMYLRAASFQLDGFTYECDSYSDSADFYPRLLFHGPLYTEPLLKAYCYLFASLGLLEITQREAPKPVMLRGKSKPISIFDSLDAVRITDFGRWCLDLTKERPEIVVETCEAIADKELYLVTVRGASFECTLFLNIVGIKLGENRWRISPGSFIAGCSSAADIEDRLLKFRRLIDSKPAPHWERLFTNIQQRANALNRATTSAQVFCFEGQRELFEELLRDRALSACAIRAEGGFLIVPDKHKKKFLDLATEHGVLTELPPR